MIDRDLLERMASELASGQPPRPMELVLQPVSVLQLTGLLQLALRHPHLTPEHAEVGRRFLAGVRQYFADCPAVLEVIRRGDEPRFDAAPYRPDETTP